MKWNPFLRVCTNICNLQQLQVLESFKKPLKMLEKCLNLTMEKMQEPFGKKQ